MSRYIDADEFWNNRPENLDPKRSEFNRGWVAYAKAIRECLDETPTADVVEVRHGEWKKSNPYNRFMNCSVCGFGQNHTAFKYCPNCGTKMKGGEQE